MRTTLLGVLVFSGCGFSPVEELTAQAPDSGALSTPVGALPLSVAWRSCAPNDGAAMDVMIGSTPTCAQHGDGLHLSLWGALTAGAVSRVGQGQPNGVAETCAMTGCSPLSGTVTVVSVSDTELIGAYQLTEATGEQATGTFSAPLCASGVLCG
jgi:hypothetical protein